MNKLRAAVSTGWVFACLAAAPVHAQVEFPGAGGVGLDAPPGMVLSTQFAGFEDRENGSSIVIAELPAEAYPQLVTGFTDAGLASRGIVVTQRSDWSMAGAEAFLVRGTQAVQGVEFAKWMLVAGNAATTALVTVQIPESVDTYPDAVIEEALRTVQFRAAGGVDEQIAALPFVVGDLAGFRTVRTLAGSGLLLTEGPNDVVKAAEQPIIVIAASLDTPPAAAARDDFARHAAETLVGVRDLEITTTAEFRHDDADWHRIEAAASEDDSGVPVKVTQVIRFTEDGWIRTAAIVAEDAQDRLAPRLRRLAESVAPRD